MKKVMMIAVMMLMGIGAFAQGGKFSVGVNAGMAAYGNEYNPFGVGVKAQYEFVESFRAEAAYNYWLPKDDAGIMDFNLNLQYLIPAMGNVLYVYPLVGVNLAMTHGDAFKVLLGEQQTIFGFQGGCGVEYYVAEQFKLNFDVKYQYNKKDKSGLEMKYDGPVFQVGAAYVF